MPSPLFEIYQQKFDELVKKLTEMLDDIQKQSDEQKSIYIKDLELNIGEMERTVSQMEIEIVMERIPDNKKKLTQLIENKKCIIKQYNREIQDIKFKINNKDPIHERHINNISSLNKEICLNNNNIYCNNNNCINNNNINEYNNSNNSINNTNKHEDISIINIEKDDNSFSMNNIPDNKYSLNDTNCISQQMESLIGTGLILKIKKFLFIDLSKKTNEIYYKYLNAKVLIIIATILILVIILKLIIK